MELLLRPDALKPLLFPQELLEVSQAISRQFAPVFNSKMTPVIATTKLAAKELLEISAEISREYKPVAATQSAKLVLLPVDPDHVHAYWQDAKVVMAVKLINTAALQPTLRLYASPAPEEAPDTTVSWHDIAILDGQSQQTIALPKSAHNTVYSAAIGQYCPDGGFIALVQSNSIDTGFRTVSSKPTIRFSPTLQNANKSASGLGKCVAG
jgi:hypothetical protein